MLWLSKILGMTYNLEWREYIFSVAVGCYPVAPEQHISFATCFCNLPNHLHWISIPFWSMWKLVKKNEIKGSRLWVMFLRSVLPLGNWIFFIDLSLICLVTWMVIWPIPPQHCTLVPTINLHSGSQSQNTSPSCQYPKRGAQPAAPRHQAWHVNHTTVLDGSPCDAHDTCGFVLLPPYTVLFCSPHSFLLPP